LNKDFDVCKSVCVQALQDTLTGLKHPQTLGSKFTGFDHDLETSGLGLDNAVLEHIPATRDRL